MLTIKRIPIDSYRQNVAYLHRKCVAYQLDDFSAVSKIEIHGGIEPLWAIVNLVEDDELVKPTEIGLSLQAFHQINLPEGAEVTVSPAHPPVSLDSIRRKVHGGVLSAAEYGAIINDIANYRYSKMEIAAFLVASASFMTAGEVLSLTEAMEEGEKNISWDWDTIVDAHCVGGLLGNRTDMIVVPIVAAFGLPIPKIAARAIGSPCGTADVMEVLADVMLGEKGLKEIVAKENGSIIWGDYLNLAPSDAVLRAVERPLGVYTPQQMVASVLSKKLSAGITHLVIDIPVGSNTKIRTMAEAMQLRKMFEHVGDMSGMTLDIVVTDGSEPVGRGIGPTLEARDVMNVLRCKATAPQDLREKSLFIAGRVLEFDSDLRGGQGYFEARDILDSGRALEAMNRIIHAQGRATPSALGKLTRDVTAPVSGTIDSIDSTRIMRIVSVAGSPRDKGAGIDLFKKVGDFVERGEALYRIYANNQNNFAFANGLAEGDIGYEIASRDKDFE